MNPRTSKLASLLGSASLLAMADVAPSDSGLASGLVNTTGQLGGALGIAVLATLATSRTDQLQAAGANSVEALLSGFHLAFITSVALVAAGHRAGGSSAAAAERGFGRWTWPCICTTATMDALTGPLRLEKSR